VRNNLEHPGFEPATFTQQTACFKVAQKSAYCQYEAVSIKAHADTRSSASYYIKTRLKFCQKTNFLNCPTKAVISLNMELQKVSSTYYFQFLPIFPLFQAHTKHKAYISVSSLSLTLAWTG
jgi:hypothetical protein